MGATQRSSRADSGAGLCVRQLGPQALLFAPQRVIVSQRPQTTLASGGMLVTGRRIHSSKKEREHVLVRSQNWLRVHTTAAHIGSKLWLTLWTLCVSSVYFQGHRAKPLTGRQTGVRQKGGLPSHGQSEWRVYFEGTGVKALPYGASVCGVYIS